MGLTLELSGWGVRRLRRRGEHIAGGFEPTCNVLAANPSPLQRIVRHVKLLILHRLRWIALQETTNPSAGRRYGRQP